MLGGYAKMFTYVCSGASVSVVLARGVALEWQKVNAMPKDDRIFLTIQRITVSIVQHQCM